MPKEARQTSLEELARAQRRIAALERKIGQQQVELDFFQRALLQVRDQRLRSGVPGGTATYEVIQAMTASRSRAAFRAHLEMAFGR
jgi:hypothetical protein